MKGADQRNEGPAKWAIEEGLDHPRRRHPFRYLDIGPAELTSDSISPSRAAENGPAEVLAHMSSRNGTRSQWMSYWPTALRHLSRMDCVPPSSSIDFNSTRFRLLSGGRSPGPETSVRTERRPASLTSNSCVFFESAQSMNFLPFSAFGAPFTRATPSGEAVVPSSR